MPRHRQCCHLDCSRHHTAHRKWRQQFHQVLQQLCQQRILIISGEISALGRHPTPCRMATVTNCKTTSSTCQQTTRRGLVPPLRCCLLKGPAPALLLLCDWDASQLRS